MNYADRIIENRYFSYIVYGLLIIVCLTTRVNAPLALLLGLVVAQLVKNPFEELSQKIIQVLLKCAVVGLGFGMNTPHAKFCVQGALTLPESATMDAHWQISSSSSYFGTST